MFHIKEMKIKTTRYHQIPTSVATWKQSNKNSYSLLMRMQNGTVIQEDSFGSFLQNSFLPYDRTITLLGIYRKELNTYPHKVYKWMFIATLFIIYKTWNQMSYKQVNGLKKQWDIQTMEYI